MDWFGKSTSWKSKLTSNNNQSIENPSQNIGKNIIENEQTLKILFQNCSDIMFREVTIHGQTKLLLIYVDGMINTDIIISNVLKPLMYDGLPQDLGAIDSVAQMFEQKLLSVLQTKKLTNLGDISEHILKGNVAILVDGENTMRRFLYYTPFVVSGSPFYYGSFRSSKRNHRCYRSTHSETSLNATEVTFL
jgi:spore germination protein